MLMAEWSHSKLLHAFSEHVQGGIPHHKEDFTSLHFQEGKSCKEKAIKLLQDL